MLTKTVIFPWWSSFHPWLVLIRAWACVKSLNKSNDRVYPTRCVRCMRSANYSGLRERFEESRRNETRSTLIARFRVRICLIPALSFYEHFRCWRLRQRGHKGVIKEIKEDKLINRNLKILVCILVYPFDFTCYVRYCQFITVSRPSGELQSEAMHRFLSACVSYQLFLHLILQTV